MASNRVRQSLVGFMISLLVVLGEQLPNREHSAQLAALKQGYAYASKIRLLAKREADDALLKRARGAPPPVAVLVVDTNATDDTTSATLNRNQQQTLGDWSLAHQQPSDQLATTVVSLLSETDSDDKTLEAQLAEMDTACEMYRMKVRLRRVVANDNKVYTVLQTPTFQQVMVALLCSDPGYNGTVPCDRRLKLPTELRAHCVQQYVTWTLLAYNDANQLVEAETFFPSACACSYGDD